MTSRERDRAAIAQLPGPLPELVAAVVRGIRLHAFDQGVAAEDVGKERTSDVLFVEPDEGSDFARVGDELRRLYRRGQYSGIGGAVHLTAVLTGVGVARQVADEGVVEGERRCKGRRGQRSGIESHLFIVAQAAPEAS